MTLSNGPTQEKHRVTTAFRALEIRDHLDAAYPDVFTANVTAALEALAPLDADGDGWITRRDPGFAELRVWRDTNQDRRSSRSELGSADESGLVSIELRNHVVPRCGASGCEMERARFTFRDANARLRQGSVIDVHLVER